MFIISVVMVLLIAIVACGFTGCRIVIGLLVVFVVLCCGLCYLLLMVCLLVCLWLLAYF